MEAELSKDFDVGRERVRNEENLSDTRQRSVRAPCGGGSLGSYRQEGGFVLHLPRRSWQRLRCCFGFVLPRRAVPSPGRRRPFPESRRVKGIHEMCIVASCRAMALAWVTRLEGLLAETDLYTLEQTYETSIIETCRLMTFRNLL
jgi:hypothetical protein